MSKEATGQSGVKLGSTSYWNRINRTAGLHNLMGDEMTYHATLRMVGSRASDAIEEIYEDLAHQGSKIRFISSWHRNTLAKQVEGLYDVCKMAGSFSSHSNDCIHALDLSILSPWHDSSWSFSAVDKAVSIIEHQSIFSKSEAMKLLQEGSKWGISFTAGSDNKKKAFLEAVLQGEDNSFLKYVADEYQNKNGGLSFTGKCGHSIGSRSYIEHFESYVFRDSLSSANSATFGSPDYDGFLRDCLRAVAHQIERDLDDSARQNDYITDETAAELKNAVEELENCGISVGFIDSKIEKLAWFVGGDSSKILHLQRGLKFLGFGDYLTEDGVYGEKTLQAWNQFVRELEHGIVPTLRWTDLLQSERTGISISSTKEGAKTGLTNALQLSNGRRYVRFDPPHPGRTGTYRGTKVPINYNHINLDAVGNSNALYDWIQRRYNHYPLDDFAYNALKDLRNTGKKVRISGKVLLIGGIVLDILELGIAVNADIKDADRKLGKTTISTAAIIGGSWTGAAVGAKVGAMVGTLGGPAAPLTIPVLSLIGGIAGSIGGSRLAEYVVDITYAEE